MLTTLLPPTAGSARVGGLRRRQARARRCARAIGAALQEAALDPLLTGRDHLRLQTMLQGIPRAERVTRTTSCSSASASTDAADRKVGGYSGGMKRRLDLALALVHRPRHPLPRRADDRPRPAEPHRALGGGRRGWRSEDGVTVFLTTQYLEEADVLADRVGIIDHGRIVAEGTPAALKAEIGRPSVAGAPGPTRRASDASLASCERFGEPLPPTGETERRGAARAKAPRPRGRRPRARRGGARRRRHRAPRADARRRLPREDGPLARGRGRERARRRRTRRADPAIVQR